MDTTRRSDHIAAEPSRSRRKPPASILALVALSIAAFAYVTAEGLPVGLIAPMAADLGVTPADIGLLVTVYGGVVVVASIPLARLTLRLSRRTVMLLVLATFTITPIAAALAPDYEWLTAARIVMALSQSLFWAAVVPAAAGLVSERHQGRAISLVFAGSSLAGVLGIPLGTWIGQLVGWRLATGAVAVLAAVTLAMVWRWMPDHGRQPSPDGTGAVRHGGPEASTVRYAALIAVTMLGVGGLYVSFTFFALFVTTVAGFGAAAIGPLLLARGLAGLAGVAVGGALADRMPRAAILIPTVAQALALVALYLAGSNEGATIGATIVSGFAFSALTTALGSAVLRVAPGDVNLAAAGLSVAVNMGIAGGSLVGSLLVGGTAAVPPSAIIATVVSGAVLATSAIGFAVVEAFWHRPSADAPETAQGSGARASAL